ncbi:type III-A CRISPR-associated protein Csm2 [Mannheimia massilioguelmaensis]|uniref:type III-A CRISPR-associated protein Csm2 n=1 Tax=Mannheimia massilioguelmaensis TaxID=1604354 RepID=UPI0005CB1D91|nr:type III-A CRISPR-associated protein Csm2 [Mannheimia massilioguelmaensis]
MNIKFGENKSAEIFSTIAENAAQQIKSKKDANRTTQLRKFYDELAMWNDRVQTARENREAKYKELEPFIKMLKAKVAYAQGRKHIDAQFSDVFNRCIDEVKSAETLRDAKLFMEAVMGYCKLEETRKNA